MATTTSTARWNATGDSHIPQARGNRHEPSRRGPHRDHLPLAAFNDGADMVFPQRQRAADLALVARSVVDARRASLVAGLVVKDLLDDMRLHPDVGHAGRRRASDIAQLPVGDARAPVEIALVVVPRLKARR